MNLDPYFSPYPEVTLTGKRALVTGASSGIGLATACRLAAEGVNLVLVARRENLLQEIAAELKRRFPHIEITLAVGDVTKPENHDKWLKQGLLDVDILVNNAGLARGLDTVETAKVEDWEEMIQTNVTALIRMVRKTLPGMIARKGGHIVNISSVAGRESYERGSVYCATKHAVHAFSKALRIETCDKNIKVSLISPGMVKTEFSLVRFSGDTQRADSVYAGMEPLNANDIAHEILFALKQPSHVNIDEVFVLPSVQGSATKVFRKS